MWREASWLILLLVSKQSYFLLGLTREQRAAARHGEQGVGGSSGSAERPSVSKLFPHLCGPAEVPPVSRTQSAPGSDNKLSDGCCVTTGIPSQPLAAVTEQLCSQQHCQVRLLLQPFPSSSAFVGSWLCCREQKNLPSLRQGKNIAQTACWPSLLALPTMWLAPAYPPSLSFSLS